VKSIDAQCPFCSATMHEASRAAVGAAMVLGIGLAVGGCSSSSSPMTEPPYGLASRFDAGEDAAKDAAREKDVALKDTGHEKDVATRDADHEKDVAVKDAAKEAWMPTGVDGAYGPPPGWGWDDVKESGA
jgi:hypothetical protein